MSMDNPDQAPIDPSTGMAQEPALPEPSDAEAPDVNEPETGFGAGESTDVDPDLALNNPTDEDDTR